MRITSILLLIAGACIPAFSQTDAITVAADGNVGIHAPSPAYTLDVGGNMRVSGSIVAVGIVPIGAIVAFHANTVSPPLPIPEGWQACDDSPITDPESPLYRNPAVRTPNLNGSGRFLRGGAASGATQEDGMQGHWHDIYGGQSGGGNWVSNYDAASYQKATTTTAPNHLRALGPVEDTANGYGAPRVENETRPKNMSVVWIMRIK